MAIYIEHWEVTDNPYSNRIDFVYTDEQREQGLLISLMRHAFFEENGVGVPARLLRVNRIEDMEREDE